ncbi:MAG: hypothetical protein LRZ85_06290 [Alphaproteobacteria bacterium]|nr:hypothetical protein [Alphaproteobacteria bacterium]MCD8526420.1 hypothetical protein [Alphaproteobacteria bacterium]MCD8571572.1 hypothetical protein [Alphaproteobacteria bacterium]
MPRENMTPLGPDNKYASFLKNKFKLSADQIIGVSEGPVTVYNQGRASQMNMVIVELTKCDPMKIPEMQMALGKQYTRLGVPTKLINLKFDERIPADRNNDPQPDPANI